MTPEGRSPKGLGFATDFKRIDRLRYIVTARSLIETFGNGRWSACVAEALASVPS